MSSLASLIPLHKVLGPLLIGSWVNGILFTVEIIQVWRYFQYFQKKDSRLVRLAVAAAFASDVACTSSIFVLVYQCESSAAPRLLAGAPADPRRADCISHWGDVTWLLSEPAFFRVFIATTGITGAIVQCFLARRACRLIPNKAIKLGINSVLVAMSLLATGCAFWVMESLIDYPIYVQRQKLFVPALVSFVATFVTDISITLVFLSQMYRLRKAYLSTGVESRLGKVITDLSYGAIETGAISMAFALASMLLFLFEYESNFPQMFSFCIGRLYTCSMLLNLNSRAKGESPLPTEITASPYNSRHGEFKIDCSKKFAAPSSQVHILHDHSIHIDESAASSIHLDDLRDHTSLEVHFQDPAAGTFRAL